MKPLFVPKILLVTVIATLLLLQSSNAQSTSYTNKQINHQIQSWVSVNSTIRVSKKWGIMVDVHYRSNQFFANPNFYFVRLGGNYWINEHITAAAGWGHLWLAPSKAGFKTCAQENRLFQQIQMTSKIGTIQLLNRLRNEQRWQEKIVNDKRTNEFKFTNRVRYLASLTIPISKNEYFPSLVLSDELCIQMGKEVVYNTFDQNRAFLGFKQRILQNLHFDIGYMLVNQQKSNGYQYDQNSTYRCFFYYTPNFSSHKKS